MEIINNLLHGIRSGEYWFIRLAIYLYWACVAMILINQRRHYKKDEDQVKAVGFAARMVLASIAILIATVLFVVIPGPNLKWILIGICAIVIIMMIKVDKLPIWMEEEK